MWILLISDGDVDYTYVFGPFNSEAEAYDATPEGLDEDYEVRARKLKAPAEAATYFND